MPRRPGDAVARHRGTDALQPGHWRHGQGPPGPRDRRPGRADGLRDRRDRNPVQTAQPQPRASGLVTAGSSRQTGVRTLGTGSADRATERHVALQARRADPHGSGPGHRAGIRGRRRRLLPIARGHHRHVSERPDSHRRRAASGRPGRRATDTTTRGVAGRIRFRNGPAEDRHPATATQAQHRLLALRRTTRRR